MSERGAKRVSIKPRGRPSAADDWVSTAPAPETVENEEKAPAKKPMKRLTIDVPENLHRRVKMGCARRGFKIADEVRRLLEQEFPAKRRKVES